MSPPSFIAYPPLEKHGAVGDRRTCALVAADGAVDWMCLPDFHGAPVFGALIDAQRGGVFRLGPRAFAMGSQTYLEDTAVLRTRWELEGAELELVDAMLEPEDDRAQGRERARTLVRRLTCVRGEVRCMVRFEPRPDFHAARFDRGELEGAGPFRFWTSMTTRESDGAIEGEAVLRAGDSVYAIFEVRGSDEPWSAARVDAALEAACASWRAWSRELDCGDVRSEAVRRAATTVHLLTYAPLGSVVAAPTTSIPERIGGSWNADYRLTWVRDASLSMETLAVMGDLRAASRYLDWLAQRGSTTDAPLQVAYGVDGALRPHPIERQELDGYRSSRPVRFGNHAYRQRQLDALAYLLACALTYLEHGGAWRDEYRGLVERAADYIARAWTAVDHSLWELAALDRFVSSRVMAWVALDDAARIAERTKSRTANLARWRDAQQAIRAEIEERGFNRRLGAFSQRIGADNLDAAALLIPVMDVLPANDPRVAATVARVEERLTIEGWVYRFRPEEVPKTEAVPFGQYEGAFVLCSLWLATAHAKMGNRARAERILERVDRLGGGLGLLPEGVDARSGSWLGNFPLLFTHCEYVRAVRALSGGPSHA